MKIDIIKIFLKEKRFINVIYFVLFFFVLLNVLVGIWNEISSGNWILKINELVIRYFIKCFKMLDRKFVLYIKCNCMIIVKFVYVYVYVFYVV